jgi:chromosome segregation ATPase
MKIATNFSLTNRLLLVTCAALVQLSCDNKIDNQQDQGAMVNQQYEAKMGQLEKDVDTLAVSNSYQQNGFKLMQEVGQRTQAYLGELSDNLNGARAPHLPKWEEMFDVLTNPAAMTDESFVLGAEGKQNNFFRQQEDLNGHAMVLADHDQTLAQHRETVNTHGKIIEEHERDFSRMDDSLQEVNRQVDLKFTALDEAVKVYDGRIADMENRMRTMEITFRDLQRQVNDKVAGFEARLTRIERLLDTHDLKKMAERIKKLEETTLDHGNRIKKLETDIELEQNKVADNTKDLQDLGIDVNDYNTAQIQEIAKLKFDTDNLKTKEQQLQTSSTTLNDGATNLTSASVEQGLLLTTLQAETKADILNLSNRIKELQTKIDLATAPIEVVPQELEAIRSELDATIYDLVLTGQDVTDVNTKLEALRAQVGLLERAL